MSNAISIHNLTVQFGKRCILNSIDLDVRKGETLAVIGPSGTGKSTIIKVLTGLLKPTSGSVKINDEEVCCFSESEWDNLRKHMGVVFQYSALFDFMNVKDNIAFGLRRHYKVGEKEVKKQVEELLTLVDMYGMEQMMPSELSGGMKKRVGLARALAMQPDIVYYDEPTSGLDPVMTMNISKLIRKTQKTYGVTSILVTHDMESVFVAADRVAMLYKGDIVALESVDTIKNSKNPIVQAFINGQEVTGEDKNEQ